MSMSNGIDWIGTHSTTAKSAARTGMLGGISLTCARGLDADEFLIALGTDLDELAARTPYKDLAVPVGRPGRPSPRVNPVMYGTCGGGCTCWRTGGGDVGDRVPEGQVDAVLPGRGDRLRDDEPVEPPSLVIHAPGDGHAWRADFGQDTGRSSALDAALRAAGAVFLSLPDEGEAEVVAYYEEHRGRLSTAVFTAIGNYCELSIDPVAVQAGDLPSVLIPMV